MNKKIKQCFELKKGKTYWICVGDKEHEVGEREILEIMVKLEKCKPKINFIVAPYYVKPIEIKQKIIERRKKNGKCNNGRCKRT